AIDPTTLAGNVIVTSKFQGHLTATVTLGQDAQSVTIQPTSPLLIGDIISVVFTSGIKNTGGGRLLSFQKQFTVTGTPFCLNDAFVPVTTNLPNVANSSIEWADYDGDGKLDAVITGTTAVTFETTYPFGPIETYLTDVYHNDGNGQFTPIHAGIT